jgi:hypothetical protein
MTDFSGWKYYKDFTGKNIGITKTNVDGSVSMILLTDPDVSKWLAEGNTPLPSDE